MDENDRRGKIVKYLIVAVFVVEGIFLAYGLARDEDAGTQVPALAQPPQQTELEPQVGCQQPTSAPATGEDTIPPNPGVSARKAGETAALVSVTVPASTQECRVVKIRLGLDSVADEVPATTKTVNVLSGPPVRRILINVRVGSGAPQTVRATAVTQDGRSSTGALVSVR